MLADRTKTFFIIFFLLVFPSFLQALDVSRFIFTTDSQTISPNTLSSIMTIQSQDSSGTGVDIPNTMYVSLNSSSATGEFFSNTSGSILSLPVTMAKNSQNKNFYYQDSALGTHTIQASISSVKGGTILFSTQQQIVIGESIATATPSTINQTSNNTEQNSSNNTTAPINDNSVHYSSVPLSNVIVQPVYKVGAGRTRVGIVETPIEFKGESNADFSGQTIYKWSFGDGAVGYGHIISHAYDYPGDYVVVLNATSPAGQAVSQTDVKIIFADFTITYASPERIEVENKSKYEINLFGRELVSKGQIFVFPEDTIIKSGMKISFTRNITKLSPTNISEVSFVVVGDNINKSDEEKTKISLSNQIQELQKEIAELPTERISVPTTSSQNKEIASVVVASKFLSTSTATTHRSWFEKLKLFFFGKSE